jgi:RNA polymerase sigma-70 factor (sigma-E family)
VADWEDALVELLQTRGVTLMRHARLLTGNEHEAEDLLQDALVRVFTRHRRGKDPEAVEVYLRTVMANLVLDSRRRGVRWLRLRHKVATPVTGGEGLGEAIAARQAALAALAALSPQQRACLVLRYYDDLPVAEIAARVGIAEGTVKRHLHDGTKRLAALLSAAEEGGGGDGRQR